MKKIFYGWWIVGSLFIISLLMHGVIGFGFTGLIEPLREAYGWSYTQISLAMTLRGLEAGTLAPIIGFFVDRIGPKKFVLCGCVISGSALIILGRMTTLWSFYLAFALIVIGTSSLSPTVTMATTANWFQKKMGLATGIMHSGAGFAGLILPIVVLTIERFEIQNALMILGLAFLVITVPLAIVVRDKPEKYGLVPDGFIAPIADTTKDVNTSQNIYTEFTFREALKSRVFWSLSLIMLFQLLMVSALLTHIMPYLENIGIDRTSASLIAGAIPLVSVAGRFGFGWASDKIQHRWALVTGYSLISLGLLCFALAYKAGFYLLIPAVIFFSIGFGGNAITRGSIVRAYFGRKNFGSIHGLVAAIALIGTILGAPIAGWFYDTNGSYENLWLILTFVALVPLLLSILLIVPRTIRKAE